VGTRKGSVRFFDKMRGLEAIGSAAFAAALLGLFSFRLSHSCSNKSFNPRVVKSSVCPNNDSKGYGKGQNDDPKNDPIPDKQTKSMTG
jgi:hypothetical protein